MRNGAFHRGNNFGKLDSKPGKEKDSGQVSELDSKEAGVIFAGRLSQLTTLTYLDLRRVSKQLSCAIHVMLMIKMKVFGGKSIENKQRPIQITSSFGKAWQIIEGGFVFPHLELFLVFVWLCFAINNTHLISCSVADRTVFHSTVQG